MPEAQNRKRHPQSCQGPMSLDELNRYPSDSTHKIVNTELFKSWTLPTRGLKSRKQKIYKSLFAINMSFPSTY